MQHFMTRLAESSCLPEALHQQSQAFGTCLLMPSPVLWENARFTSCLQDSRDPFSSHAKLPSTMQRTCFRHFVGCRVHVHRCCKEKVKCANEARLILLRERSHFETLPADPAVHELTVLNNPTLAGYSSPGHCIVGSNHGCLRCKCPVRDY